jgi:hypothetical protein
MVTIRCCCHKNRREKLFDLRRRVHEAFDEIWISHRISRKQAYRWLAERMNLRRCDCHVRFFNIKQCYEALQIVRTTDIQRLNGANTLARNSWST